MIEKAKDFTDRKGTFLFTIPAGSNVSNSIEIWTVDLKSFLLPTSVSEIRFEGSHNNSDFYAIYKGIDGQYVSAKCSHLAGQSHGWTFASIGDLGKCQYLRINLLSNAVSQIDILATIEIAVDDV